MDLLTRPIKAGSVNAITPGRAITPVKSQRGYGEFDPHLPISCPSPRESTARKEMGRVERARASVSTRQVAFKSVCELNRL